MAASVVGDYSFNSFIGVPVFFQFRTYRSWPVLSVQKKTKENEEIYTDLRIISNSQ